jgi:hypothetical protein
MTFEFSSTQSVSDLDIPSKAKYWDECISAIISSGKLRSQSELDAMLRRLRDLQDEDFESQKEREIVMRAIEKAEKIVTEAETNLPNDFNFIRGWASLSPELGVRVEWSMQGRQLRLVVNESEEIKDGYIYREDVDGSRALTGGISSTELSSGLQWLLESSLAMA